MITIPIAVPATARLINSVIEMLQPLMSSTVSQSEPFEIRRGSTAQVTAAFDVSTGQAERNFYYVAANGSDSNSGIEQRPFRTLKKGVSVLRPGDTLYVKNGTYVGSSQLRGIPSGSSWTAPVTIAAYPGHRPVIVPESKDTALYFIGNHHIIIDGFIIDGARGGDGIKITWEGETPAAHHIRIRNTEIKNAPGNGILITGVDSHFNEFINLHVHHNGFCAEIPGDCLAHGLYTNTSNNLVDGGKWHDNAAWGIHIYRTSSNNIVRNAFVYNHGSVGVGLAGGVNNRVFNNIVFNNKIGIWVVTPDGVINKNMIYNNREGGILVGISRNTISNNFIYSNGGGLEVYQHAGPVSDISVENNLAAKNGQNFKDNSGGRVMARGNLFDDAYDSKFLDFSNAEISGR
jgi:hypothetical protein